MRIIAGIHRNKQLATPKRAETRPTSGRLRETLFNICQNFIEGASFLDLCAGSGGIGLEALSRGASFATFVEHNREAAHCIEQNIKMLQEGGKTRLFRCDLFRALEILKRENASFTLIYADPPYHNASLEKQGAVSLSERIIRTIDESNLLAPGGVLFIEEASEYAPNISDLRTLVLAKNRKAGNAALLQFVKAD